MSSTTTRHIHLVGSMNLPSATEAMTLASDLMGDCLLRLPDGEPGPRRGWIYYQRPMFTHNRYLDAPPGTPMEAQPVAMRVLREGVTPEDIEFPELGYAREAQTSYTWFKARQDAGALPAHLRFQVSLPTPLACLATGVEPNTMPLVEPAYEAAMLREIETICAAIPHDDLAMQWDVCVEMLMYDGQLPMWSWTESDMRGRFRRLLAAVPADVHLGVHLCYGDFDGKHMVEPVDAERLMGLANLVTELAARPLQWIHLPVPKERDDAAYFQPLEGLELDAATELFLGLVHLDDGLEGARRRIDAASEFVPGNFGIATECGIGRMLSTPQITDLFRLHRTIATEL